MEEQENQVDYSLENSPANPEGTRVSLPQHSSESQAIPVTQIRRSNFNPRFDFDEDSIVELASSINLHGVLQPIIVRPLPPGEKHVYEIVVGERRYRAVMMLGQDTIPAIVREISEAEATEEAIVENLERRNLNPMEEARGYFKLTELGYTQERIATRVGRRQTDVAKRLMLLDLPDSVQVKIAKGDLSATHGEILHPVAKEHPKAASDMADTAVAGLFTTSMLRNSVKSFLQEQEDKAKAKQEKEQPRLSMDEVTGPAGLANQKSAILQEEQKQQEKAQQKPTPAPSTPPATTAPVNETTEPATDIVDDVDDLEADAIPEHDQADQKPVDGDAEITETVTELQAAATHSDRPTSTPTSAPNATENAGKAHPKPEPTPAPVTAPAAPAGVGPANVQAFIRGDQDDFIFESNLTVESALDLLKEVLSYRLSPLATKLSKALADLHNSDHPDDLVTPSKYIEDLLISIAEGVGYDIETLKEIPL